MPWENKLGESIKQRRKALRVSQAQLAELAGISVNTLYKIERGQTNPRLETLSKIGDVLGMEVYLRVKEIQDRDLQSKDHATG